MLANSDEHRCQAADRLGETPDADSRFQSSGTKPSNGQQAEAIWINQQRLCLPGSLITGLPRNLLGMDHVTPLLV